MTEAHLSDPETLMWRLETDPWFQSSFGALSVLDGPVDFDYLECRLLAAVIKLPRLRQRLVERPTSNPEWQTDVEFDLRHHLRRSALATGENPLDVAARLVEDPLDRTRPLWQFHVLEGLGDGRSAVLTKFHHSLTDGEGGVQIALEYMDLQPERTPTADRSELLVQLRDVLESERPSDSGDALGHALRDTASRQIRRWRDVAGEAAMFLADPARIPEQAGAAMASLRQLSEELPSSEPTSTLWRDRSRRRQLRHIGFELAPALQAARELGGTLNDLLLTAVSIAAVEYHREHDTTLDRLQGSYVISTRGDDSAAGNAFAPTAIELPGEGLASRERFALIAGRAEATKASGNQRSDLQTALAGPARLIPMASLLALARRHARRIDIATSNLRSAPVPIWVGGAVALSSVPIGPVAGTACNVTLMSYADRADIGLHIDPEAIADADLWRDCVVNAFGKLIPDFSTS